MATTWAVIGILGVFSLTLLVLHATLHARISALSDEMNRRFDELTRRVDRIVPEVREETRAHKTRHHQAS